MIQKVRGKATVSGTQVFEWVKWFQSSKEDITNGEKHNCLTSSGTANDQSTIKKKGGGNVRLIFTKGQNMTEVCAEIKHEVKGNLLRPISKLLERTWYVGKKIVTADDTCVFQYNPNTKSQSLWDWKKHEC